MDRKSGSPIAGLFIGLGLLGAGYFMANSFRDVKLANQNITIKGFAQKDVISDFAKWSGRISETGQTRQEAFTKLQSSKEAVYKFLKSKGIDEKNLEFSTVNIYPFMQTNEHGRITGEIAFFTGDVQVNFQSDDVEKVSQIAKDSEELINQGVGFTSEPPQYLYSKLDDVKVELLGDAAKDAKSRAEEITSKVDSDIGAVKFAQQGVFQITARNDTSISSSGMYDTTSIEKTVKAVVTLSFAIEN